MWDYTDNVRDHFLNPRNVGSIPDADAIGEVGSLACGDALKLYLKIDKNNIIADAKFQTFGCASAIASSSVLTEMIIGLSLDQALKINNQDIATKLGGLPQQKMHCSVMGQEALEAAIRNFRGEKGKSEDHGGHIICKCFGVTDQTIIRAIRENHLSNLEEITHYTKAGGACGDCHSKIQAILDQELNLENAEYVKNNQSRHRDSKKNSKLRPIILPKKLTNVQRMQQIIKVLDEEVSPRLQLDGGDIELIDLDGKTVFVALRGMCSDCPSSQLTIKDLVEKTLREYVEPDIVVEEVL